MIKKSFEKTAEDIRIHDISWKDFPNLKEFKPGYLYTITRAISSRINANLDAWPVDELKTAYKTFIKKPVYVEHHNWDPKKARGVILDAIFKESKLASGLTDGAIYLVTEVDAKAYPKLANAIREGKLKAVSMGCDVGFTVCSVCGNHAEDSLQYCAPANELVGMADGTWKPIQTVIPGEVVLTHLGPQKVLNTMSREFHGDLLEIYRRNYPRPIRLTPGHEVLNFDNPVMENHNWFEHIQHTPWKWTPSDQLTDENSWVQIAYPTEVRVTKISDLPFREDMIMQNGRVSLRGGKYSSTGTSGSLALDLDTSDKALAWIAGLYLAEGSFESNRTSLGTPKTIQWSLSQHEGYLADYLQLCLDKLEAGTLKRYHRPEKGGLVVRLSNAPLAFVLDQWCGRTARDKALSPDIMLAPKSFQIAFVNGYEKGDGWDCTTRTTTCRTASEMLSRQMVMLSARVHGVGAGWNTCDTAAGGPSNREKLVTSHLISITNPDFGYIKNTRYLREGIFVNRINKIINKPFSGTVYNLEVENSNSYTIEGICVHNCGHIPHMKGQIVDFEKDGRRSKGLVSELCKKLSFFEISYVFDPADESGWILKTHYEPERN